MDGKKKTYIIWTVAVILLALCLACGSWLLIIHRNTGGSGQKNQTADQESMQEIAIKESESTDRNSRENTTEENESTGRHSQETTAEENESTGRHSQEITTEETAKQEFHADPEVSTEPETAAPLPYAQSHPAKEPVTVSLVMIGDMLLHDVVQETGLMPDGSYNYDHFFTHTKDEIQKADVAVVNQEVIIGGAALGIQGYPCFNCREEVGSALVNAGFDIVLHATNHAMDQRQKGIDNCMSFWDTYYPYITYLGIHKSQEDYDTIRIYEKDGFRIALLNYTYGLNGFTLPAGRPYLVNLLDEEKIRIDIETAKQYADLTVVFPHWGTEYRNTPDNSQRRWAQLFADCGADLVIGTHPHVIEPVEWITGAGGNHTLVYYSLGNFISAQDNTNKMLGAMAKVTLVKDKDGARSADYAVLPTVTQRGIGSGNATVYFLKDYNDELAAQNRVLQQDPDFSVAALQKLCREVFGDLYGGVQ